MRVDASGYRMYGTSTDDPVAAGAGRHSLPVTQQSPSRALAPVGTQVPPHTSGAMDLGSLAALASDPVLFLSALDSIGNQAARRGAEEARHISADGRRADQEKAIEEARKAASFALVSSVIQAAMSMSAGINAIANAAGGDQALKQAQERAAKGVDKEAAKAAEKATQDALSKGATDAAAKQAGEKAAAKVTEEAVRRATLGLAVRSLLPALVKDVIVNCKLEVFHHLSNFANVAKSQADGRAEADRKAEDDAKEAAQNIRQLAESARNHLQKLSDLRHEARLAAMGKA